MSSGAAFELIARRIRAQGPMSLADYMALALAHPKVGYYATRDPFGKAGDFTTAPEISQVFGELLGLWCAERWQAMGEPTRVVLVELGPGRGTLMSDALRAAATLPAFRDALEVHLVEASPFLREKQRTTLKEVTVSWHEDFASVPKGPLLLLANEFFDALPIRQFQRVPQGWAERLVGLTPEGTGLAWGLGPPVPAAALPLLPESSPGTIAEVCPAGRALAAEIGRRIARDGGAALIVDYGYARSAAGDSLQALQDHRPVDPLAAPGEADLTAHVDFQALAEAAEGEGAQVHGPVEQGDFLRALGIETRTEILARNATAAQRRSLAAALDRLTATSQMGSLFKVLALTPAVTSPPAGFPLPSAA